ncbi:hypothetical protein MNBD_GAMMA07-1165 [hydrothermal vent metagenome]|uniref:Lipopolysaccharide assembly protein A domain-containing protein n=1 Tax=hydrothermal vent metagenome TaxID=652676 RepID=A0A3B0WJT7_9ZZZZ
MIRFISLLVSIPLVIFIAAFTYNNAQLVTVDLFTLQIKIPLALLLLLTLLVGIMIGFFFNIMALLSLKKKQAFLARKQAALKDLPEVLNKSETK